MEGSLFLGKEQHVSKPRGGKEFSLLRNGKTVCVCVCGVLRTVCCSEMERGVTEGARLGQ